VRPTLPLLLLVAIAATGCGAERYPAEPPATAHLYLNEDITGLDPVFAQDEISGACCLQIFDAPYEYEYLVRPYQLKPCLAEALPEVSEDGLVHRFRIRPGVLFHDDPCFPDGKGREVTADDVVFSLKRLMDARLTSPGSWVLEGYVVGLDEFREASRSKPRNRAEYEAVEGLRAFDRYGVEIRLTRPYPQLHWVLAMVYASVYPHEAIQEYGDEFLNHPVGTGPYRVSSFRRTQRLVLDRNPAYREDTYPTKGTEEDRRLGRLDDAGKRIPFCDRLVFTVYKETQPMWLDFLLGYLDRGGIPKDQFDSAVDPATGEIRADLAARGVQLEKTPAVEIIYDAFNQLDPVLGASNGATGLALRRAMSLAFDEEWARKKLYNDRVESIQGLLVPEFPEFDPEFVNPWKRGADESYEQALARARKLLADAGHPGGQGIPPIYAEVTDTTTDDQFHAAFKRDMARIGLDIRGNRVTFGQMLDRVDKGQAQLWGLAWGADYPDAQNFFQLFYGPNKAPGPNGSNYQNPEFDRLYEESLSLFPGERRTEIYRRMQRILVEDCAWIFKYRRIDFDLMQPWLHNYKRNTISSKYGKYLRVESALRDREVARINEPVLWPVWVFVVIVVGLYTWTRVAARRRVRGW